LAGGRVGGMTHPVQHREGGRTAVDEIGELTRLALGLGAEAREIGVAQMALRAVVVYVATVFMVRLGKKRFMGQGTAFDLILGIMLGSTVSRAITGTAPFFRRSPPPACWSRCTGCSPEWRSAGTPSAPRSRATSGSSSAAGRSTGRRCAGRT
jgi:hypothetical protein